MNQLKIKKEFESLIPALTSEEFAQLEQNCLQEGIRDKIVAWNNFIVDGHNRYKIANKHDLKFNVQHKEFESENDACVWIIQNQFGRRNLSTYTRGTLALELEKFIKPKAKEKQRESGGAVPEKSPKPPIETRKEIAKVAKVSDNTISRIKVIEQKAKPEVKDRLHKGDVSINKVYQDIKKEQRKEEKLKEKKEVEKKVSEILEKRSDIDLDNLKSGWYKLGNQYLYYGNNKDKEFYSFLPKCKLGFADPPYNAGVDKWDSGFKWEQDKYEDKCNHFLVTPGGWNAYNFYNETKMNYQWEMCCWIKNGMTHGRCGYANFIKVSVFGKDKPKIEQDFFSITIKTGETLDTNHKGRKPYEFMTKLINDFSNEGDNIFDLFAGSGTTLFMSEKLNRVSYNAELDKQYCIDIIKKGLANKMEFSGV